MTDWICGDCGKPATALSGGTAYCKGCYREYLRKKNGLSEEAMDEAFPWLS